MLGGFMPSTLVRTLELMVFIAIIVIFLVLLHRRSLVTFSRALNALILLFALYSLFIVARGDFSGGAKEFIFTLNGNMHALPYVFPFIILFLPNRRFIKDVLNVFYWSCLMAVPLWLINAGNLVQTSFYGENIAAYFPYFAAFLLAFLKFFSPHRRICILLVYLFYFLLMVLNARRNVVASLFLYGLVAVLSNFKWNISNFLKFVAPSILLIFVLILNFTFLSNTVLQNLLGRLDEDTRSNVELLMLADFASSPVTDTILGRGMDGTYFHDDFSVEGEEQDNERTVVETGYLNFVLKGGIIYMLLVVIITITSIVRGLKHSNAVPICMPLLLMVFLLDFYMTTPLSVFSTKLIIYWFIVSFCFQKKLAYVRVR